MVGTRLTVVSLPGALALCGLLRSEGIECAHRNADISAEGPFGAWQEVLVAAEDLERAQTLLDSASD